jgi:hypothetical protein
MDGIRHRLAQQPYLFVGLIIAAQIAVWTFIPYLWGRSLPLDVVSDGLSWGHEWQWGYFKHPPLPSWEVEAFFNAFGDIGPYLLSQISVGLTYLFVFLLGRALMGAGAAAAGTALTVFVYFFSLPTPEFNHNVAQMPLWAALSFAYYQCLDSKRLSSWIALGVVSGLALLTKYSSGVLLAVIVFHYFSSPARRAKLATPGPYLAIVVCALVIAPHVTWLVGHHFPTLTYAAKRAGEAHGILVRLGQPLRFLVSQLIDNSAAIAVAALVGFIGRKPFADIAADEKLFFLAVLGLGPALLTALVSLLTGMGLRDMWGAPMWNLTGLLIVYAGRARAPQARMHILALLVAAAFVVLPFFYVIANALAPMAFGKPSRTQWPDRAMAAEFAHDFQSATGAPLKIVAGNGWLAGLIAMRAQPRPSVFTDANMAEAPWITPARLAREGALVIWQGPGPMPAGFARLPGLKVMGTKRFAWHCEPKAPPLEIGWAIVRPPHPTLSPNGGGGASGASR